MSYSAVTSAEVAAGEPTKQELFTKIKDNFSDHETRLTVVEAATAAFLPIEFNLTGRYADFGSTQTGVLYYRVPFNMTLTGARLLIWTAGSAGTTEMDVLYKRGVGAYTTIFTTKPSVAYGSGDNALSTNAVISVTSLLAADLLRLDISAVQTAGTGATLFLEYEKA